MNDNLTSHKVRILTVEEDQTDQRIANFLIKTLKGVPKTRIYRMLRKGEVRVNSARVKPDYRLQLQDKVRVPPVVQKNQSQQQPNQASQNLLANRIVYEDAELLVINKPSGIPVHAGSGVNFGVIEILRALRPELKFLELVHRLDKDTSGCLLLAKKRSTLVQLHALLRDNKIHKSYLTLVKGTWQGGTRNVTQSLQKNVQCSQERVSIVNSEQGKAAKTQFKPVKKFQQASLLEAILHTGRTHQIRVHASFLGRPIAGDSKYGDREFNKQMSKFGLKRLFLHAHKIAFRLPNRTKQFELTVELDDELTEILTRL